MRKRGKIGRLTVLTGLLFFFLSARLMANSGTWATVSLNKGQVTVGEPLMITITLYTSTWFTSAPQFGEIQVPGAIMVDFPQRTGSLRKQVGNRSYPAIEKKYLVYPLMAGENTLPSVRIVAESPPEGDYRGRRVVVRSPERTFRAVTPEGVDPGQQVLTAYDLSLSEEWNRPTDDLKQGDVLERRIMIRAGGAIAALIPPLVAEEGSFGSVYRSPASLSNTQGQSSFTGTRTEHWTYLLEKEGEFNLPAIRLSWYHPGTGELREASLPEMSFSVAANPDMEFLLSMQDSLQALLAGEAVVEPESKSPWGLALWQVLIILVSALAFVYLSVRLVFRIIKHRSTRKARAAETEAVLFRQITIIAGKNDPGAIMKALIVWFDAFRAGRYEPSLRSFIQELDDPVLAQLYAKFEMALYRGGETNAGDLQELARRLRRHRLVLLKQGRKERVLKDLILNP